MPLADEFARKRSEFFTFILQTQIQAQITRSDLNFLSNLLMLSIDIFNGHISFNYCSILKKLSTNLREMKSIKLRLEAFVIIEKY